MEGFKVRCQSCGLVLYETTEYYTCHKPLTGDMLRLLPLYRDWPTYDGSLAVSSTSRFLMFCSQCANYVTPDGKLKFADFPDTKVTEISQERSEMPYNERPFLPPIPPTFSTDSIGEPVREPHIDDLILPNAEDSALSDDLQKADTGSMTPEDMMKKIEKQAKISSPKHSKKGRR